MLRKNNFTLFGGVPSCTQKKDRFLNYKILYFCQKIFSSSIEDKPVQKKKEREPSKYKHTLLLPSTAFQRNPVGKSRVTNEENIQKIANFPSLYDLQASSKRQQEFILHDGPPYANGKLHMGHALNKILKDVTVRYKFIKGYKVSFIPGWDCHGLPIELKALEKAKAKGETSGNWENFSPIQIREKARTLANETIELQRNTFDQWGLFLNWREHYSTKDPKYVAKQLKLFLQLYQKGYIFQAYMPVHFSPSSKTTLAESELEYNEEHISPSLYLALPLTNKKSSTTWHTTLPIYFCIWTTTPWTLPANMAICASPDMEYAIVETDVNGRKVALFWVKDREEDLKVILQGPYEIITHVSGKDLIGLQYIHPVYGHTLPVIAGIHVSNIKGTGLVHTAPAHGKDDFLVALANGIPTDIQLIDNRGCFKEEAGDKLKGLYVLKDGNEAVIRLIKSFETTESSPVIVNLGTIKHSYPYDWRTKKPTIISASKQWFFDINKVKNSALDALQQVKILPAKLETSFVKQIDSRPYWCLSRQRVWGVPIPVFYDYETTEPVINSETVEHITNLIEKEGPDVWWKYSAEQLLPPNYVQKLKSSGKALPKKGEDILDIWFDSGSSWHCAMNGKKADLYIEGYDQINGWFQSSLLISVAATGEAPYKMLVLHCFTVDEHRQKMSKSIGNVYNPNLITHGGKNKHKTPTWGVNILRWWAVSCSPFRDVLLGNEILKGCENDLISIRSVFWYSLACLNDFNPDLMLPYRELRLQEKYLLSLVKPYLDQIWNHYEHFEYDEVSYKIYNFTVRKLSEEYLNTTKDIMYCGHENDIQRKSIQTTLYLILPYIIYSMAPLLPHLAEEVVMHYQKRKDKNIFIEAEIQPPPEWNQSEFTSEIKQILEIKRIFMLKLNEIDAAETVLITAAKKVDETTAAEIGNEIKYTGRSDKTKTVERDTAALKVHLKFGKSYEKTLRMLQLTNKEYHSNLCSFLSVSEATLEHCPSQFEEFTLEISKCEGSLCIRCRKYCVENESDICSRCKEVVNLTV